MAARLLVRETHLITTIQGCVRSSRGSAARHGRSYGRICTSRRARLHAHDCVATEIIRLLAQLHDGNVQTLQVSRRYAKQPLRLVGPEAAALGVVGDAVERVYVLVVVVAPAAHLTLDPACGGAVEHHDGADTFHRTVDGQLDEHENELQDGEAVSRREVEHPVLLARHELHGYALAASAHRRSPYSGQVLGGRLPPRGAGHPPCGVGGQRAATLGRKTTPTATHALTKGLLPPPTQALCVRLVRTT